MAVTGVNNYFNTYANAYTNNVKTGTTRKTAEDYIRELQEKNPQINIMAGNPDRNAKAANYTGRTDVRIAPEFLNKMMGNSQIAAKYENMLSQIPALDRWANSMIKSITGNEVKYRQVWIDENGNMGSFCISGPTNERSYGQEMTDYANKIRKKKSVMGGGNFDIKL